MNMMQAKAILRNIGSNDIAIIVSHESGWSCAGDAAKCIRFLNADWADNCWEDGFTIRMD